MQSEIATQQLELPKVRRTRKPAPARPRAEKILGIPVADHQWTVIASITPSMAAALLETMPKQRPLRKRRVADFVADMRAGEFQITHQGIAVDSEGNMIDGQHRCRAIMEFGQPVVMQVTLGCDKTSFVAIDRGAVRTVVDDLVIMDVAAGPMAHTLQAAARITLHYEAGRVPWTSMTLSFGRVVEIIRAHPYLSIGVKLVHEHPRLVPGAVFAGLWAIMRERDEALADQFAASLFTGEGLRKGQPVYALRESIVMSRGHRRTKTDRNIFAVKLVRAWNATRKGQTRERLAGYVDERYDGSFPKIA